MERLRRAVGFSLVELLVSMVLLSIIVLLSSYSYAQFSRYWDGRLGNFDVAFSQLRDSWLLEDILYSIQPYVVKNDKNIPRFYFEGNVNGFVAVSNKSISAVAVASVIRISLVPKNDQTFELLYEEAPMSRSALTRLTSRPNFSTPRVLFDQLINPEFSYFGRAPRSPTNDSGIEMPNVWNQVYNSAATSQHPQKIRLSWTRGDKVESWIIDLIQPRGGELDSLKPEDFDV